MNVQFLIDEASSTGPMPIFEDAVDKFRAYEVRMIFIYQSLGQIKSCWPDGRDQVLLSNVTQIYFGINDPVSAEHVSQHIGDGTIVVENDSDGQSTTSQRGSSGGSDTTSTSVSYNRSRQQIARRLLKPEELIQLSNRIAITLTPGVRPILTYVHRYYETPVATPRQMSRFKLIFDTVCLFLAAAFVAALATGCIYYGTTNQGVHFKFDPGVFRQRTPEEDFYFNAR